MLRHVPSYIQEKKLLQRLGVAQSSVVDMQFGYDTELPACLMLLLGGRVCSVQIPRLCWPTFLILLFMLI